MSYPAKAHFVHDERFARLHLFLLIGKTFAHIGDRKMYVVRDVRHDGMVFVDTAIPPMPEVGRYHEQWVDPRDLYNDFIESEAY